MGDSSHDTAAIPERGHVARVFRTGRVELEERRVNDFIRMEEGRAGDGVAAVAIAAPSSSESGMNMSGPSGPTRKSVGGSRPMLRME